MIIGVDAGALSVTDDRLKVGVWRVTYNLLKELAMVDTKNEYRLYTFTPIGERFGGNMHNVVVRPRIGWSTIQLPIELRRHPIDVFLGLSQMIPYSTSYNIGFIYDLGFLHYPDAYPGSAQKLKRQTQQLVERSDAIITISEFTKKEIRHKNVTVAYPGIDSRFSARGVKHKERHPYILFVGALKRGKNVPMALRIFKQFLKESNKPYDFVIVGGNYWEDPEIEKTMKHEGLQDNVKIKGFVPDNELPSYYRGAQALLITSLWEGFCLPAVEAMACACPVVYVTNGSLSEIVGNAGTSFTTEHEAVAALQKKKSVADGLVRAKRFSWSRMARDAYRIMTTK